MTENSTRSHDQQAVVEELRKRFKDGRLDSESTTFSHEVELSADQIRNMEAVPVELIPAPGPGKMIFLDHVIGFLDFGTERFLGGGTTLEFLAGTHDLFQVAQGYQWLIATADRLLVLDAGAQMYVFHVAADWLDNLPIMMKHLGGGEFTQGDSVVRIKSFYSVFDSFAEA